MVGEASERPPETLSRAPRSRIFAIVELYKIISLPVAMLNEELRKSLNS
jgi:hypothetical protein